MELDEAGPAAIWRGFMAAGRLRVQRCGACGSAVFEPRVFCPHCGEEALDWIDCSGDGSLYAFTIVRRKPDHGGDYGVALVDLAEGVRVMTRPLSLEGLAIGMPVGVHVEENPAGGHWLRCASRETAQ